MKCPECGQEMTWCEQLMPKYITWWNCPSCGHIEEHSEILDREDEQ